MFTIQLYPTTGAHDKSYDFGQLPTFEPWTGVVSPRVRSAGPPKPPGFASERAWMTLIPQVVIF